jgi:hypothetical protein
MAMDGAQVSQVESADGDAPSTPLNRISTFDLIQLLWVNNSEAISKNTRTGIDVGVVASSHFAAARACAWM